jgi:hypothetical protein
MRHDLFDSVTPPSASRPRQDYMCDGSLAFLGLTQSFKGDGSD